MPEDLKYIINQSQLTDIGAAIRSKLGEQDTYTVDEMPEKISEISGGSATITKTYTLIPAGTYTAQVNSGVYSIHHYYDYEEPLSICTPDQDIVVTINNVPYTFSTDYANHSSTYPYQYKRIDGNNTYYLRFTGGDFRLDVPSAGDYDVEAVTITMTGKPLTVKPVDQDLNSFGISIAAKVGETYVCYIVFYEEGEIELPVDLLISASLQIYD